MNRIHAQQILMLNSDSTFNDAKYAYRKLTLQLHPDKNKNEEDGRRFRNVLEAYHFLKAQNKLKNSNYRKRISKIQKKIGVNLQKILKWMKTFGGNMKNHFGVIMNLETRNLERITLEKHFGMKAKKMLIQNPKRNTVMNRNISINMI
jgi:DnaJ-class molecular chaperone